MHVNVDKTGGEDGVGKIVGKINHGGVRRDFLLSPRGNGGDEAIFNKDEWVEYLFLRCVEAMSAEDDHVWSIHAAFGADASPV